MKSPQTNIFTRYAIAFTWVYFSFLFGWLLAYLILGDYFGFLGFVNSLAVYLFCPLPLTALVAGYTRRRSIRALTVLGLAIFIWFWGTLLVPQVQSSKSPHSNPTLTVMTYNVLGMHEQSAPVIEVIRTVAADVICLQEVNPGLAAALTADLLTEYPYQILDPQIGVSGMGTISKYPIRLSGENFRMGWVGVPQIMALDFEGTPITLVNLHTYPYVFGSISHFVNLNIKRPQQAQVIVEFASQEHHPLIVAGDFNDSALSQTYRIITQAKLSDTWQNAGFGLGHTFPGSNVPGSSRPRIGPWYIPKWLTRIDYVFVSPHWDVLAAEMAPFDDVSDHRGVVVQLTIKNEP
jgi:endonuclease/exonuclease/phosphatase (EEP) superfamily protein YafD